MVTSVLQSAGFRAQVSRQLRDLIDSLTIFELNLVVLAVVAVSFGIVWIVVNTYHFYPFLQFFVLSRLPGKRETSDVYVDPIDRDELPDDPPTIDILLPAYEEGNVIHQSIESIRRTNYPQDLINLVVLLEPDDDQTKAALEVLDDRFEYQEVTIPEEYSYVRVPDRYPGLPNKPRALNYGFELTDGDIVGVIDAEDIVDPDLFLHVYSGLVEEGYDYVQGILDMVNEGDGWKNTIFRAEYAWWFQQLIPAFRYSGYPVPLGGTTNFAHRSVLEDISEARHEQYGSPWDEAELESVGGLDLEGWIPWDPRNVTEDFELGLFLWKEDYKLGLLDCKTLEESPVDWNSWIRQRTRWQKGKLYTFVQYAYNPPETWHQRFHLMLQSFLPHLAPVNISGIIVLALIANLLGLGMPVGAFVVLIIGLVFLVAMNVIHSYSYWKASNRPLFVRLPKAIAILTTLQLYWVPLWGAEQRAIVQLYSGEGVIWAKTTHHGRNMTAKEGGQELGYAPREAAEAGDSPYEPREVAIGLLVLLAGLLVTFVLPLVVL